MYDPIVLIPISVIVVTGLILGRNELVKRRLICPRAGTTARVDVVRRFDEPDRPVRVRRCSLFPDPDKVDCPQDCLRHPV